MIRGIKQNVYKLTIKFKLNSRINLPSTYVHLENTPKLEPQLHQIFDISKRYLTAAKLDDSENNFN